MTIAKRVMAAVLAALLFTPNVSAAQAPAPGSNAGTRASAASPVVLATIARAARKGGWVKVVLRDARVLSGAVVAADQDRFTLRLDDTDTLETIAFTNVKKAKGQPTPTLIKVAVGVGGAIGALLLICAFTVPKT